MKHKTPGGLVTPKERLFYALLVFFSLAIYGGLGAALYLSPAMTETVLPMLVYIPAFALVVLFTRGMMMGQLRGNAIHVTPKQFPRLYEAAKRHAAAMGLKKLPEIFVMQSGGLLNAFATRFLGRDFVVIYSDVLALAEERGEAAVGFIVAHELAHLKRGHLRHRWLTNPGRIVPYLGAAYSRACEYTCDRFGTHCQPDGAVDGLLVLAAGRELYRSVDAREYVKQIETQKGFFVKRAELMASHPFLPKRVAEVIKQGAGLPVTAPAYSPMRQQPVAQPAVA
jgi:Zn-dependent protease with chaperone function